MDAPLPRCCVYFEPAYLPYRPYQQYSYVIPVDTEIGRTIFFKLSKKIAGEENAYIIQLDAAASMLRIKMRGVMVINQLKT